MIFQSLMGLEKSRCDILSGITQRWACFGVHQCYLGILVPHIHELYAIVPAAIANVTYRIRLWFVERWYHHGKRIVNGGKKKPHVPVKQVLKLLDYFYYQCN